MCEVKTVSDWVLKWKRDCGTTKDPGDRQVVIRESEDVIYQGHALDIPQKLYDRTIISSGCVVTSSVPGRAGAYSLEVKKEDLYLASLYDTLEMCDLIIRENGILSAEQVERAQKLRKRTMEDIKKREAIPLRERL